ncbi:MAG: germination protein YpeB [Clostridia bacterium]|nr:germination protein YpeB [Clostridia bacterium]
MVKKQTIVKIVSFLSAALLVIGGFWIREYNKNQQYLLMIENQYSRAFEQLNSSLNSVSIAMQKMAYVSSAKKMGALSAEIFSEAELAKTALSELPMGQSNISTIYRFLSQVGNYTLSVSKNITNENGVSSKQREELKKLSQTANEVTQVINDSGIEHNNAEKWAKAIEDGLNNVVDEESLAASLTELEENLADYPTLIYDGPYSDHILEKQPLMTGAAVEYSQNEAQDIARKVAGADNKLRFEDMQGGKIECYRFVDNNINVAVSKRGGYVVYMRKNRVVGENLLSYEQALLKAKRFLQEMQIYNMTDTYYYTDNGVCVINFAYLDGQTICYTDLIKVGVAMDTGEIMLLETAGYLTNHTERAFKTAEFTIEQASEKISSDLEISESAIALIPTDSGGEVRCYEFLCKAQDNQEILVYINMLTLEEEQIYILLKSDGGTLVK